MQDFSPLPLQGGIRIHAFVFDRGMLSGVSRLAAAWVRSVQQSPGIADSALSSNSIAHHWLASVGCALHDTHNALKWALSPFLIEGATCLEMRRVQENLGKNLSYLVQQLPTFLRMVLRVRDKPDDEEAVRTYWQCLGIASDWLGRFVAVDPLWFQGGLWVNPPNQEHADLEDVTAVILYLFRFRPHTESRWLSMGPLLACVLVGFTELSSFTAKHTVSSADTLTSAAELLCKESFLHFAAVAALVAFPCESLLLELMEDARVCHRQQEILQCLQVEKKWLEDLPWLVWSRLDSVLGRQLPMHLRSEVLQAAAVAQGYVHMKLFQPLAALPWSLLQGDVAANVKKVASGPVPQEEVAKNIWALSLSSTGTGSLCKSVDDPNPPLPTKPTSLKHSPRFHLQVSQYDYWKKGYNFSNSWSLARLLWSRGMAAWQWWLVPTLGWSILVSANVRLLTGFVLLFKPLAEALASSRTCGIRSASWPGSHRECVAVTCSSSRPLPACSSGLVVAL